MKIKKNKDSQFYADKLELVVKVERVDGEMCFLTTALKSKDGFTFDIGQPNLALHAGDTLTVSGLDIRLKVESGSHCG